MGKLAEKRRESLRIPVESNIWVRDTAAADGPLIHGKLRDLGIGGLMFTVSESLGVNSFLDMLIDTGHGLVRAWGRVAHENQRQGNGFETGVAFFEFDIYAREAISLIIDQRSR